MSTPESCGGSAEDAEGSPLCLACGLCCNGELFENTVILPHECAALGLAPKVASDVAELPQPCRFHAAGACAIYAQRPDACDRFRCRLLSAVVAGEETLSRALRLVADFKVIVAELGELTPPGQDTRSRRMELETDWRAATRRRDATEVQRAIAFRLADARRSLMVETYFSEAKG